MSEILTATDLAEIREKAEKATPGPWFWIYTADGFRFLVDCDEGDDPEIGRHVAMVWPNPMPDPDRYADVIFITEARTDIPRLLATVDAYREIVDALANEAQYQSETGEGSTAYLARLIKRARALLDSEETAT